MGPAALPWLIPVLCQYCASTVSVLCQYCGSTVAVLWQYCGSTVSVLCQLSSTELHFVGEQPVIMRMKKCKNCLKERSKEINTTFFKRNCHHE